MSDCPVLQVSSVAIVPGSARSQWRLGLQERQNLRLGGTGRAQLATKRAHLRQRKGTVTYRHSVAPPRDLCSLQQHPP